MAATWSIIVSWLLALVIVAFLFIGGCALWIQAASDSTKEYIGLAERSYCYDTGYADGRYGNPQKPPREGGEACDGYYADGYADALSGGYDFPESE